MANESDIVDGIILEENSLNSFIAGDNSLNVGDNISQSIQTANPDMPLPVSIFNNDSLSALETISKYLVEELCLRYCIIAGILNRDQRTIWGAYSSAKEKLPQRFQIYGAKFTVPSSIFRSRKLSVLESITQYLKDELNLRYCKIATLLNRNDRTIWTVYQRAKKKLREENGKY